MTKIIIPQTILAFRFLLFIFLLLLLTTPEINSFASSSSSIKRRRIDERRPSYTSNCFHNKVSAFQLTSSSSSEGDEASVVGRIDEDDDNNDDRSSLTTMPKHIESVISIVGSTTSFVVAGIFFAVLLWKRDALLVSFFIGAITNGIVSKVLKKILNQSRPPELESSELELKPSDGGMPSSHAMSLGFIGIFTALNLPQVTVPLILYVAISLYYRVRIVKLHTREQIIVGLIAGSLNGIMWYNLCTRGVGDVNIMNWVSTHLLDGDGLLPWPYLAVPAGLGLVVVGSFERRIGRWLENKNK